MAPVWAQRREELLSDCIISPNVCNPMIDRLAAFVVPYQQALETEAAQRNLHRYLQGLLSHLPSKNAEDIATFVNVERLVIQEFIGTAPWDHRPLIEVLVPQVVHRLGERPARPQIEWGVSPHAVNCPMQTASLSEVRHGNKPCAVRTSKPPLPRVSRRPGGRCDLGGEHTQRPAQE